MTNIWDVAKLAGVSKSTVSRVLTQSGPVREETRQKISQAIEELHYHPSYFGQGIRTGKTKTIAFVLPDNSNVFYNQMVIGVEEVALAYGYMVLVCNTNKSSNREVNYIKALLKRSIDGIVLCTYKNNRQNLDYFLKLASDLPIVFMDKVFSDDDPISSVLTEGRQSNAGVVRFLADKGCKRIAYIHLPRLVSVVNHRFEGYKDGLLSRGLAIDSSLIYQGTTEESAASHIQLGANGAQTLMSLESPPDAIMASTDMIAIGALKYLKSAGYKIPKQIKVVGYDNIDLCELVEPSLTTLAQPIKQLGIEAGKIIIEKILNGNEYNKKVVFEPELIVREST